MNLQITYSNGDVVTTEHNSQSEVVQHLIETFNQDFSDGVDFCEMLDTYHDIFDCDIQLSFATPQ